LKVLQTSYELFANFYECLTNFLWTFYKLLVSLLQAFYKLLTSFLQTSYELFANFLWTSYKLFYECLTNFLWTFTNFLWTFCKLLMNLLQTSHKLFTHITNLLNILQITDYIHLINFLQSFNDYLTNFYELLKVCKKSKDYFNDFLQTYTHYRLLTLLPSFLTFHTFTFFVITKTSWFIHRKRQSTFK